MARQEGGAPWLVVSRRPGAVRMRFGSAAEVEWRPSGRTLTVHPLGRTPIAALRRLALDHAVPLVLAHDRLTVLHASASVTPAGLVAFIGPTGAGKSTMAAAFGARGCPAAADDAVMLRLDRKRRLVAVPAYAAARLRSDMYRAIGRRKVKYDDRARPLAGVYLLDRRRTRGTAIRIELLSRRESLIALIAHSYVLDVADRRRLVSQLDRLTRECLPFGVRRVVYPHGAGALERVQAAVLADVARRQA